MRMVAGGPDSVLGLAFVGPQELGQLADRAPVIVIDLRSGAGV